MNEGHSAFAALEVARQRMAADGISFDEAANRVAPHSVFTTHTPVPAGHDRFSAHLIEEHLGPLREELGCHTTSARNGTRRSVQSRRRILHDGAGDQACRAAATPSRPCTGRCRGPCGRAFIRGAWPTKSPSAILPTVCMLSWLARPCARCSTGTCHRLDASHRRTRHVGADRNRSTMVSCGKRTRPSSTSCSNSSAGTWCGWESCDTSRARFVQQYRRALSLDTLTSASPVALQPRAKPIPLPSRRCGLELVDRPVEAVESRSISSAGSRSRCPTPSGPSHRTTLPWPP